MSFKDKIFFINKKYVFYMNKTNVMYNKCLFGIMVQYIFKILFI